MSGPDNGEAPRKRSKKRRTLASTYKANNAGGYGNPPVKNQFAINNKGGPGRPKGEISLEAEMRKMLRGRVPLKDGGSSIPMTKAFALAARKTMLSNGVRGIELGLRLASRFEKPSDTPAKLNLDDFNDIELDLFESLMVRAYGVSLEAAFGSLDTSKAGEPLTILCRVVRQAGQFTRVEAIEDEADTDP